MTDKEPDSIRRTQTKPATEARADVGAILRAARLKRNQSIDTVAHQTRIPKRYLDALESNRFDEFPAVVYLRGFLKSYCDYLDVPFESLWAKIQPAVPSTPAAVPTAPIDDAESPVVPAPAPASTSDGSSAAGAVFFALVLVLALGVWLFHDHHAPAAKSLTNTPRALMPLPRTTQPHVSLHASDDAWVRVTIDDDVVFEGRMPRGATMEWKPSRYIALRATSTSALELVVNGTRQPLANPSADGEYRIDIP